MTPAAVDRTRLWKAFPLDGLTLKTAATDAPPGQFSGYASTWTKDVYGDMIQPGAFGQTIADKKGKVPIFFNHDENNFVGFSTSLAEDHKGLMLQGQLALGSSLGADVYALLSAASSAEFRMGLSIGFIAEEVEWDGNNRLIKQIDLWEISFTPFPANQRSFVDDVKAIRDFEKRLRDVGGYSVNEAKRILAHLATRSLPSSDLDGKRSAPARDVREGRQITQAKLQGVFHGC